MKKIFSWFSKKGEVIREKKRVLIEVALLRIEVQSQAGSLYHETIVHGDVYRTHGWNIVDSECDERIIVITRDEAIDLFFRNFSKRGYVVLEDGHVLKWDTVKGAKYSLLPDEEKFI